MSDERARLLQELVELVELAKRVHNIARSKIPSNGEGHFVNENTLIRIDEALETVRQQLGMPRWERRTNLPGFDAYITMRVYRNSIVHHKGTLNEEFHGGRCTHGLESKKRRKRKCFKPNYERFCASVGVDPLQPGDRLGLSVTEPDFLTKLIEGVCKFACNAIRNSS